MKLGRAACGSVNQSRRSCALLVDNTKFMSWSHQGHFKVKFATDIENTHFWSISSCLVVQSSIMKDWWWHILGRVSFQHTFLENLGQCWYIGRGNAPHVSLITPRFLKAQQLNKQNYNNMQQRVASARASIAKDWHIIGYEGWNGLRLCFTAWMSPKINVKVMSRSCKMSGLSVYGWYVLNA